MMTLGGLKRRLNIAQNNYRKRYRLIDSYKELQHENPFHPALMKVSNRAYLSGLMVNQLNNIFEEKKKELIDSSTLQELDKIKSIKQEIVFMHNSNQNPTLKIFYSVVIEGIETLENAILADYVEIEVEK